MYNPGATSFGGWNLLSNEAMRTTLGMTREQDFVFQISDWQIHLHFTASNWSTCKCTTNHPHVIRKVMYAIHNVIQIWTTSFGQKMHSRPNWGNRLYIKSTELPYFEYYSGHLLLRMPFSFKHQHAIVWYIWTSNNNFLLKINYSWTWCNNSQKRK